MSCSFRSQMICYELLQSGPSSLYGGLALHDLFPELCRKRKDIVFMMELKVMSSLTLPEMTAPDGIALFSSSLRNRSSRNITHKVL